MWYCISDIQSCSDRDIHECAESFSVRLVLHLFLLSFCDSALFFGKGDIWVHGCGNRADFIKLVSCENTINVCALWKGDSSLFTVMSDMHAYEIIDLSAFTQIKAWGKCVDKVGHLLLLCLESHVVHMTEYDGGPRAFSWWKASIEDCVIRLWTCETNLTQSIT